MQAEPAAKTSNADPPAEPWRRFQLTDHRQSGPDAIYSVTACPLRVVEHTVLA